MKFAFIFVSILSAVHAYASASGKWPTTDISLPLQTPAPVGSEVPPDTAASTPPPAMSNVTSPPPAPQPLPTANANLLSPPQQAQTALAPNAPTPLSAPEQKKLQAEFDLETFGSGLIEQAAKLRDPFKKLVNVKLSSGPISGLESFAVDEFKLLGVLSGMSRTKALVLAPDGKTYFVSQNMRIGLRKGVIRKITPESISVKEKIINLLGEEEEVDSQIRLTEDNKSQSAR